MELKEVLVNQADGYAFSTKGIVCFFFLNQFINLLLKPLNSIKCLEPKKCYYEIK